MRALGIFGLLAVIGLAGCESTGFRERVRERFADVPPQVEVVAADVSTAYYATQLAFKRLDYTLVRSSLADRRVEAASRINASVAFRDNLQLRAEVRLTELEPGRVEVALRLTELREGQGLGGAGESPLREHGFNATYFAVLQQVLQEGAAAGPRGGK